jgi:hypothetical protein
MNGMNNSIPIIGTPSPYIDDDGKSLCYGDLVNFHSPSCGRDFSGEVRILDEQWIVCNNNKRWDLHRYRHKLVDLLVIKEGMDEYDRTYFNSKGYYIRGVL